MKVLLLGGTGAVGVPLSQMLVENGNEVYITTRSSRISKNGKMHYIVGDAHENAFLYDLISEKKYDAIVDFMVYSDSEFEERYQMLLDSTEQYVFLSSARVFAEDEKIRENSDRLLDVSKDDEFIASKEYAISKAMEENLLFESGKSNWTIIRPYISYFTERLQLGTMEKEEWLYRACTGKSIVFSRDIAQNYTTLTHGYDVADCISRTIGNEKSLGKSYNCVTSEKCKWEDVLSQYLDCIEDTLGIRPNVVWVDRHTDMGIHSYQAKYDRMYNRIFDNTSIMEDLGKTEFIPLHEGVKACLTEFLNGNRTFKRIPWTNQGVYDRISNEYTQIFKMGKVIDIIRYIHGRYIGK